MAYRFHNNESGYDESRFKNAVDENFHCSICLNVAKDARMCQHNEHIFCRSCIEEHLRVNAQRCPQCQERLTVPTLLSARFVNNLILKFEISCDFADRGCPEFINVEDLERHVENCGFAPVLCSNERCNKEINKRDKIKHETELCEYRMISSHDFAEIKEMFQQSFEDQVKMQINKINGKIEQVKAEMDKKLVDVCGLSTKIQKEMMESRNEIKNVQQNLSTVTKEMMESRKEIKDVQQNLSTLTKEMMESRKEIKDVQQNLSTVMKEMTESRKEMKDVQQNLSTVTKEMEEMKATMFQMFEKMNINEQHVQTLTSSIEMVMNSVKCDILIAGGYQNRSVEIFSWKEKKWFNIASMENEHRYASSFIYNDNLFVVGGDECKTIETLNLDKFPLTWKTFPAKLPYGCWHHQTVVCKQQIFHIGGYDYDKHTTLDQISEIKIRGKTSYVLKKLCRIPEPWSCDYGAEVVDDKVLIFGGYGKDWEVFSSVLQFDPRTFTFKEMPPLPYPLCGMATVRWRDQVVLLGGYDHSKISNSVIMYDTKTGKITVLPSMLEKRFKCCAVITGDTIVVMGGLNDNREYLKTVECFKMGSSYSWTYLPSMKEPRCGTIVEILPSRQKYI